MSQTETNKTDSKNRARRSANRRSVPTPTEVDTLRSELASVHETYHKVLRQRDDEIESLKGHLLTISNLASKDIESLTKKYTDLQSDMDITEGELTIFQKSEKEWIGRSLKLRFILDQIKKIEALPEDHASWVDPMVEQVDIPDVSINIKNEFVPTAQTDNIDWVDEEEDEEEDEEIDWTDEGGATAMYNNPPTNSELECPFDDEECFRPRMDWGATAMYNYHPHSRAILEKSATMIQKSWQNHQILKKEQLDRELDDFMHCRRVFNKWEWDSDGFHDDYATVIQRVWRGHLLRKLLEAATKGRFHQDRESLCNEAFWAHNIFFTIVQPGWVIPAEQL